MNFLIKRISLITLIIATSCIAQQEKQDYLEVIYNAETRGSILKITYVDHKIFYKNNTIEKTITLNAKEVKLIYEAISKIGLSKIKNLKSPSNKSFSDAAMSANFKIKTKKATFISSSFDHENPPKELSLLYKILIKNII